MIDYRHIPSARPSRFTSLVRHANLKRVLVCSIALAAALLFALTRQGGPIAVSHPARAFAMSEHTSITVESRGNRHISLRDGRDLDAQYARSDGGQFALESNEAQPLSLCAGDFDEDGVPDLVSYYSSVSGGMMTLHRGNADSIFPNRPDAERRREEGTATASPFLLPARVFETTEAADFLQTGDFNADGHLDLVTASRGGASLQFFAGDGSGSLTLSEKINLPGSVTALAGGQINRLDGLADLIVAIATSSGAKALIFESPRGAARAEPLTVDLPAAATSIVTANMEGDPAIDIALACGNELLVVKGRSRLTGEGNDKPEVIRRKFSFRIRSFAVGDFFDDSRPDIALLGDDGAINLLSAPKSKKPKSQSVAKWKLKKIAGETFPQAQSIQCARVTSRPGEAMVVMDPAIGKIHIIDSFKNSSGNLRLDASTMVALAIETEPVAVMGMRLTPDALDDLVILRKGQIAPAIAPTAPLMTFTVMNANGTGMGSFREAIDLANMNPGLDNIVFMAGAGPITINPGTVLPGITEAVLLDGESQPGSSGFPIVQITGAGVVGPALTITGGNTTIRGFVINGFTGGAGILIVNSGGNMIENNFIGTDTSGTLAAANLAGLEINTPNNTIGGTAAAARNLISGNTEGGINVPSPQSVGNQILGNLIGVEVNCSAAVPNGTAGVGIVSGANNNTVGGTTSGAKNMISGNNGSGVLIMESTTMGNLVQGNEIGIGLFMLTIPNTADGVFISDSPNNTVGGSLSSGRNVISGNDGNGVHIAMGTATGNTVAGNLIGTNPTGSMAVPNMLSGVLLEDSASSNVIGGTSGGAGNVISGNNGSGVSLNMASNNQVQGNLIGTQIDGLTDLGNSGNGVVMSASSSNNLIGGTTAGATNIIAYNDQAVRIFSGTGNSILGNSIFDNTFGINLVDDPGPTPNDPGDVDTGPNDIQNFPVITSVATNETSTIIQGTLNSTANTLFRVEFFFSSTCDPSGFGQGMFIFGSTNVMTNGSGNASINLTLPVGIGPNRAVTATATNLSGSTSEFSACATSMAIDCIIACPANPVVSTGPNDTGCGTVVNYPAPQITGMCGTVTCTPPSGSFFQVGSTQVTCVTEVGPTCSFNVFVEDRTRPNITCPGNVTASAPAGQSSAVVNYNAPVATDNCPFVAVSCTPTSGSTFPLGTTTVDCRARDEAVNETGCLFTVTVRDSSAPTIQCPANIVTQAPAGQNSTIVNYPAPTVSDNLPGATASCAPPSGSSFPLGTTTVTCTATDADNNRSTCGFTITVNGGPPTVRVMIDGGKDAVEFGDQTPVTPRRRPPNTASPCSFFNIENTGATPLTLTYVSAVRTGNAVTSGRISDANERGTYTLSTANSGQGEQEIPAGTTITVGVRQTVRFCLRFDPLIPGVETSTSNLAAPDVIPDLITSRCNFTLQGGIALSVNVVGNVAETLMLINPDNPRQQSTVTFARSGNEFILTYSIFDPDLDVSRARYELLNDSGQIVGQAIEVDLAGAIGQTNLVRGQSFTVEQRFTGANSHPEITGARLSVTDGEGTVSQTATSTSSSVSVRRRGRSTIAPPVMKLGNR